MNAVVKAEFRLALRVPVWCRNFKASVDGRILNGIPGSYLNIDQIWDIKSKIAVSFDLNVHVLNGGKSYPGYIAFKTGPQVLAVDQMLNPELTDLDKITMGSHDLVLLSKTLLPKGWIGLQIYGTKAYCDGKPVELKLVPFADAGQTGGDIRVWNKKGL